MPRSENVMNQSAELGGGQTSRPLVYEKENPNPSDKALNKICRKVAMQVHPDKVSQTS